jgi:hypothetical protein
VALVVATTTTTTTPPPPRPQMRAASPPPPLTGRLRGKAVYQKQSGQAKCDLVQGLLGSFYRAHQKQSHTRGGVAAASASASASAAAAADAIAEQDYGTNSDTDSEGASGVGAELRRQEKAVTERSEAFARTLPRDLRTAIVAVGERAPNPAASEAHKGLSRGAHTNEDRRRAKRRCINLLYRNPSAASSGVLDTARDLAYATAVRRMKHLFAATNQIAPHAQLPSDALTADGGNLVLLDIIAQSGVAQAYPLSLNVDGGRTRSVELPCISHAAESAQLRSADPTRSHERPCVNGAECRALHVRFLYPGCPDLVPCKGFEPPWEDDHEPPADEAGGGEGGSGGGRRLVGFRQCLICIRYMVSKDVLAAYTHQRLPASGCVQPWRVRVGPDNYRPECAISVPSNQYAGIVEFFPNNSLANYHPRIDGDGTVWWDQIGDFMRDDPTLRVRWTEAPPTTADARRGF